MKHKIIKPEQEKEFKPFVIEITVESYDEAIIIYKAIEELPGNPFYPLYNDMKNEVTSQGFCI